MTTVLETFEFEPTVLELTWTDFIHVLISLRNEKTIEYEFSRFDSSRTILELQFKNCFVCLRTVLEDIVQQTIVQQTIKNFKLNLEIFLQGQRAI